MSSLQAIRESLRGFYPVGGRWLSWTGAVLLVLAGASWGRSWNSIRGWVRSTAFVTENASSFAPGGGVQYLPRLRYQLPSGALVVGLASVGSDEVEFPAGASVPIVYRAVDPQQPRIATAWQLYSTAIVLLVAGVAILDLGLICLFLAPRTMR